MRGCAIRREIGLALILMAGMLLMGSAESGGRGPSLTLEDVKKCSLEGSCTEPFWHFYVAFGSKKAGVRGCGLAEYEFGRKTDKVSAQ